MKKQFDLNDSCIPFRSSWCYGISDSGAGPFGQSPSAVIWFQISLISLDPQQQLEQHYHCVHYSVHHHPG